MRTFRPLSERIACGSLRKVLASYSEELREPSMHCMAPDLSGASNLVFDRLGAFTKNIAQPSTGEKGCDKTDQCPRKGTSQTKSGICCSVKTSLGTTQHMSSSSFLDSFAHIRLIVSCPITKLYGKRSMMSRSPGEHWTSHHNLRLRKSWSIFRIQIMRCVVRTYASAASATP